MSEARMCDFCGETKRVGRLGAIADVQVIKTDDIKQGSICAACCPQSWRKELFSESRVEELMCEHGEIAERDLKTGGRVLACTDCDKFFEVLEKDH